MRLQISVFLYDMIWLQLMHGSSQVWMNKKESSACMFNKPLQIREGSFFNRWIDNQSFFCSLKHKTPSGFKYSTHRKQLFAFPAGTTHSALVAGARRCPLLWTVLVCTIFTLWNYREPTSNTQRRLYEVIIDVSSKTALKQHWLRAMWLRSSSGQKLKNRM